ncbi:4Fe-4S binding protein [Peptoniphilus sp. KCTC 25270]|uniref:4Fe-4S binding protein n=1 Tax=Peptoniphilus sp. KCTC 25270 TaxID=2897414 RepID=UPI002104D6A1|nr:4Fe-4S binding protein [Peptoniphilus sp. KCTC 25270]
MELVNVKDIFSLVRNRRSWVQGLVTLGTNPHLGNFLSGSIYRGKAKSLCVPGLNCYSCPAATGACPIGAFQAVVGGTKYNFSYYITGILIFLGVLVGRLICGFFCPFGWFQDLLHKIPSPKKSTKKWKWLKGIKYGVLLVAVILLPIFLTDSIGLAPPYFCKYLCPQGILEGGIPLSLASKSIRAGLGNLFLLKATILAAVVGLSIVFYRPFCKWICPLGAFYSLFNKISIYGYTVDQNKCIHCKKCAKTCKMDVDMSENQDSLECIRCGECIKVCPTHAIETGNTWKRKEKEK